MINIKDNFAPFLFVAVVVGLMTFLFWSHFYQAKQIQTIKEIRVNGEEEMLVGASTLFAQNASVQLNLEVMGSYASTSGNLSFNGEIMPDGATCSNNQILKRTGANDWDCATDAGGVSSNSLDFDEFVPSMTLDTDTSITAGASRSLSIGTTSFQDNVLSIACPESYSNSTSVGGCININNLTNSREAMVIYSSSSANVSSLLRIEQGNTAHNSGQLRINSEGTGGGDYEIRMDSDNPDIEFVETDQIAPKGVFEIDVNNSLLRFNYRDLTNGSFSSVLQMMDAGNFGKIGIFDSSPDAQLEIVASASVDPFYISNTALGDGGLLSVNTNGVLGVGDWQGADGTMGLIQLNTNATSTTTVNKANTIAVGTGTGGANGTNKYLGQFGWLSRDSSFTAPKLTAFISAEATEVYGADIDVGSAITFWTGTQNMTNPSEKMRLWDNGNLGLYDTSPDARLEVVGSASLPYLYVTNVSDGDIFAIHNNGSASISANFEVIGYASASKYFGVALSNMAGTDGCSAAGDTLNYTATTGVFSCGSDGAGGVASNSLDFDEFVDAMTLDANTTIASAGFNISWGGIDFKNVGSISLGVNDRFKLSTNKDTGTFNELIRLDFLTDTAKANIAYYASDGNPKIWLAGHEDLSVGNPHKHWSVETTIGDGTLASRFEIPYGTDIVDIETHDANFIVGGTGDFEVAGGNASIAGNLELTNNDLIMTGAGSDIRHSVDIDFFPELQTTRGFRISDGTTDIDISATGASVLNIVDDLLITGAASVSKNLELFGNPAALHLMSVGAGDYASELRIKGESGDTWQGGYLQYDASGNQFIIGVHDAANKTAASDVEVLQFDRDGSPLTIVPHTIFNNSVSTSLNFEAVGYASASRLFVTNLSTFSGGASFSAAVTGVTDQLVRWGATSSVPPSASFATFDTRNDFTVLDFGDSAVASKSIFIDTMPRDYDDGALTVYIHYSATSATSGDVVWDVEFDRIGDGIQDIDTSSWATAQTATCTVPGTSGLVDICSIAFTRAQADSISKGELMRVRVVRDTTDANDTVTATDIELHFVEIAQ